jgi:hypothetical protein
VGPRHARLVRPHPWRLQRRHRRQRRRPSHCPHRGVSVQLAGQKAKARARVGDRRQVEVALDDGCNLLESLPHPDNLDNHFVVDPAKFDF